MTHDENTDARNIETLRAEQYAAPADAIARWHETVDRAATLERNRENANRNSNNRSRRFGNLFWGFALTAVLIGGITIGFLINRPAATPDSTPFLVERQSEPAPSNNGYDVVPAAFTRGLQQHLRHSQATITNLPDDAEATLLVLQLIEQNRLFESVAEKNSAPHLARVLRAFEPVLLELAASDVAPESAQALRAQLEFELTVMLTKMRQQSSEQQQTT